MKNQAVKWLSEDKWSPEIISAVGHETGKCPISTEWIYQWIWECKHRNKSVNKGYKKIYKHPNIANAEENEDLGRIIGVLFTIEYQLKVGPKLLRNDLDWVILK